MIRKELGPISREQAIAIDAIYVKWREDRDMDCFDHVQSLQEGLKRGQLVLTEMLRVRENVPNQARVFILAQVSSVKRNCVQAVDGPVIRVTDGEYSWRVDGDTYCVPAR